MKKHRHVCDLRENNDHEAWPRHVLNARQAALLGCASSMLVHVHRAVGVEI